MSSVFVGVLVVAGFVLAILSPRMVVGDWQSRFGWSHGWPWEFLRRTPQTAYANPRTGLANRRMPPGDPDTWLDPWALRSRVQVFEPKLLLADAAVGLVASALLLGLVEWRHRRRPRAMQFTLRDGIVLVTVVAAMLGYWAAMDAKARREGALIASFASTTDRPDRVDFRIQHTLPVWFSPAYVRRRPKAFDRVTTALVSTMPHEGVDYAPLKSLRDLQVVEFWTENVRDEDLEFLANQRDLRCLRFYEITAIRGPGLINLADAPRLEHLTLSSKLLENEHLAPLAGCRRLKEVHLAFPRLDGSGLAHLRQAAALETLSLTGTNITDDTLVHLSAFSRLQRLELRLTQVTDVGLPHLYALKDLTHVFLEGEGITPAGLKRLQVELPAANIVFMPTAP